MRSSPCAAGSSCRRRCPAWPTPWRTQPRRSASPGCRRSTRSAPRRRCRRWRRRSTTPTARSASPGCSRSAGGATRARCAGSSRWSRASCSREIDLTERMRFFEAYALIAGPGGAGDAGGDALGRGTVQAQGAAGGARLCRARHRAAEDGRGPRAAAEVPGRQGTRGPQRREPGPARGPAHDPRVGPQACTRRARSASPATRFLRHAGRSFLLSMYAALRSLKLYPIENATAQKSLDDAAGRRARAPRAAWGDRAAALRGLHLRQRHPAPARTRQLRLLLQHPCRAPRGGRRGAQGAERRRAAGVADLPRRPAVAVRQGRDGAAIPRALLDLRDKLARRRRHPHRRGAAARVGGEGGRGGAGAARWPSGPIPTASRSPRT